MESICATGIRVSEVKISHHGSHTMWPREIALKGKIRTILLPAKLCRKLLKYAKRKKLPAARFFSPRAEKTWTGGKSGTP